MAARALHFVFKVGNRAETSRFYQDILGMKVLRHEEFTEGCEAACNGPYQNRWSKTMVGYGPEDTHFAIELTYNYGIQSYKKGNDFVGIFIKSMESIARAKALNWPIREEGEKHIVEAPGGYKFFLLDEPQPKDKDPVQLVCLACTQLQRTLYYWCDLLGMQKYKHELSSLIVGYDDSQVKLEFLKTKSIERAEAYGRIAFSIPEKELKPLEEKMKTAERTILTPLIKLDTPGKASVSVVILADPDGHEICFVDDENFRLLSKVDPQGTLQLERYIKKDQERMKNKLTS